MGGPKLNIWYHLYLGSIMKDEGKNEKQGVKIDIYISYKGGQNIKQHKEIGPK